MNKHILTLLVVICSLITNSFLYSQDNCSRFYPLTEGATMEYTSYNKKDKEEGKVTYNVGKVSNEGNKTIATMQIQMTDDKGKDTYSTEYHITCDGDKVNIDFQSLISEQMLQQYKDMDMQISGTDVELPNNLEVGQTLADANVAIKINMGTLNMNMNIETLNRKVEKKETITTPAGTFTCFVIYSENHTKMMVGTQIFPSRVWLAEGIGMIKNEYYTKNGKLSGSSKLTKLQL